MFNPSAEDKGGNFELTPQGAHKARCCRVIEIGEQHSDLYGTQDKVVIVFSLPDVLMDFGGDKKQKMISNPFGIKISNNKKSTMRQYVNALNPHAENLGEFLDRTCQVSVSHFTKNEVTRDRLDSVAPLIEGVPVGELDTEPFWFQWNNPDPSVWQMIPAFTQDMIKRAVNYPGSPVQQMVDSLGENGDSGENMPF